MIIIITHNSDKGENEAKRSFRPTFLNEVVSERSSQQLTSEMTFGHRKSLEESRWEHKIHYSVVYLHDFYSCQVLLEHKKKVE